MATRLITFAVLFTTALCSFGFKPSPIKSFCQKWDDRDSQIKMLITPPKRLEINVGDRVSIVCAAHGVAAADPYVYWIKDLGPGFEEKGKQMGPVAIGKSILYIEKAELSDITTYQCVVESCCQSTKIHNNVDVVVPDATCQDAYGIGPVVNSAVWEFKTWKDAKAHCASMGMKMAMPESQEENDELLQNIQASFENHPNARKFAHENYVWLGGHDTDKEGTFIDDRRGSPILYQNFDKKQPDNWQDGQDGLGMNRETGKWDDSFMTYKRPYACICPVN